MHVQPHPSKTNIHVQPHPFINKQVCSTTPLQKQACMFNHTPSKTTPQKNLILRKD